MDASLAVGLVAVVVALAAGGLWVRVLSSQPGVTPGGEGARQEGRARVALEEARAEAAVVIERARGDAATRRAAVTEEILDRQSALDATERRLTWRHHELKEAREALDERRAAHEARQAALETAQEALRSDRAAERDRIASAAGMDSEEAARLVLTRLDADLTGEHSARVQRQVTARVGDVGPTADHLLVEAIERQSAGHADTVPRAHAMSLEGMPPEDRQRFVDALAVVAEDTFTELGVDEERQQVTLRGLDPVGREVARQASLEVLERRVEATEVAPLLVRTRTALRRTITQIGERVLWEMGMDGRPELAELLGTLNYRFSYGQNALLHCQETGHLCAVLAAELGLDGPEARRAGLFHDIGKAVDHDVEGSHAIIGGEMLAILGIDAGIVHAVKAHHFDEEPSTDLAMLTICADAISASRPGARRDTVTTYVQRLDQLQQIATRHRGVERAFPMQAGREVRISVRPDQVPDARVPELCAEIAREIEQEMTYPGMIKVTVIRETTATATAS